ncbi:MAG: FAD:protein FMN transferase [Acidimicrobiales bacterium]
MAAEHRFRAMGSDAHVVVVGDDASLLQRGIDRIAGLERTWSRFLPDSEVSTLNRRAGEFVAVSSDTIILVQRAVEAWRLSGGAFDPTVLGALIRAGYDTSFDLMEQASRPPGARPRAGRRIEVGPIGVGPGDIVIDGHAVMIPTGTGFDPGGIGKGLAADLVCRELLAAGAEGVCINLGGDVRVAGRSPQEGGWTIAVEHPGAAEPVALLGIRSGAVATSTTLRRRWTTDGERRHHIIDPQTGQPSETNLTLATAIAAEGWVAEVLAKAVLLAGADHPFDIIGGTGVEALAVGVDGRVQETPRFADYLGGASVPTTIDHDAVAPA